MKPILTVLLIFLTVSGYSLSKSVGVLMAPATVSDSQKLVSSLGFLAPTFDFRIQFFDEGISPVLGFRSDILVVANTALGELGLSIPLDRTMWITPQIGGGVGVIALTSYQVFPVVDASVLATNAVSLTESLSFNIVYGLRTTTWLSSPFPNTFLALPVGIHWNY